MVVTGNKHRFFLCVILGSIVGGGGCPPEGGEINPVTWVAAMQADSGFLEPIDPQAGLYLLTLEGVDETVEAIPAVGGVPLAGVIGESFQDGLTASPQSVMEVVRTLDEDGIVPAVMIVSSPALDPAQQAPDVLFLELASTNVWFLGCTCLSS